MRYKCHHQKPSQMVAGNKNNDLTVKLSSDLTCCPYHFDAVPYDNSYVLYYFVTMYVYVQVFSLFHFLFFGFVFSLSLLSFSSSSKQIFSLFSFFFPHCLNCFLFPVIPCPSHFLCFTHFDRNLESFKKWCSWDPLTKC